MRFFSLCPHYTISFGLAKLSRQLDHGAPDGSSPVGLLTLSKDTNVVFRNQVLSLFFDFARSPTDAKPPDDCLAGVACVRRATRLL